MEPNIPKIGKILLLFVVLIIPDHALSQYYQLSEYEELSVCQLMIYDENIYQLIDSFCEWEKSQPYYMDTNFSLQLKIFFESDSNYADFGNIFIAMIRFRETIPIVGNFPNGFFPYKNTNVFVDILQTHWSEFGDIMPIDSNPQLPDYPIVNQLIEFPEHFHIFKKNCSKSKVFYYPRDLHFDDAVNWEGKYNSNQIWFIHDKNGFHFYGYNTPE